MSIVRTEQIGNATLYLGDWRAAQPLLPQLDAVLTDPPYGIGFEHGGGGGIMKPTRFGKASGEGHRIVGDDKEFDPGPLFGLAPRIALWGANHFAWRLLPRNGGWLFWDKVPAAGYEGRWSFADGELCWFNRYFPLRIVRHYWNGGLRPDGEEHMTPRAHPMQKPVRVLAKMIELAKVPAGGVIFDPYGGAFSLGVAALRMGYRYIGCEIDPRYFEAGCERIHSEMQQMPLLADEVANSNGEQIALL